jgi:hypothetical protein
MKGVLPWLVRGARRARKRDFYPALAALVSPVQKKFSSPYTISIYVSQHSHLAGRCAGSPVSDLLSPVLVYSKQYILYSL